MKNDNGIHFENSSNVSFDVYAVLLDTHYTFIRTKHFFDRYFGVTERRIGNDTKLFVSTLQEASPSVKTQTKGIDNNGSKTVQQPKFGIKVTSRVARINKKPTNIITATSLE